LTSDDPNCAWKKLSSTTGSKDLTLLEFARRTFFVFFFFFLFPAEEASGRVLIHPKMSPMAQCRGALTFWDLKAHRRCGPLSLAIDGGLNKNKTIIAPDANPARHCGPPFIFPSSLSER